MGTFAQYTINDTDNFDEHRYPQVVGEIDGLQGRLCDIKGANKVSIIISLLKDHCIKTEWLEGNKQLTRVLTSGSVPTSHVESLFSSCRHNAKFMSGLEVYIATRLA
jgi:hypothetical protein